MGTPALTTRGFLEGDFDQVAEFVHRGVQIAAALKDKAGSKMKEFKAYIEQHKPSEIDLLRKDVEEFSKKFTTIGFEQESMRYKD